MFNKDSNFRFGDNVLLAFIVLWVLAIVIPIVIYCK